MTIYTQAKPNGAPTWIDLTTPDSAASRAFYNAVFGWTYEVGGPEFGGYITARQDQHSVAGIVGDHPNNANKPSSWGLYFASSDIEKDAARVVELGGQVIAPPMVVGEFGSMALFVDPTGAGFGLWQAGTNIGTEMAEEPGSVAWCELYSSDAKKALDFYSALLGATAEPMPGNLEYYTLEHKPVQLGGVMQIDPSWVGMTSQWVEYFAVADADVAAKLISENGGKLTSKIDDTPFGRLLSAQDPHGANFKVMQIPSHS